MAKKTNKAKKSSSFEKRGGYSSGPKPVSQLKPPPKRPGAGSKPKPSER